MNLTGLVVIREGPGRIWRVARREIRRHGWVKFGDVIAFRLYNNLWLGWRDDAWKERVLMRLRARFPAELAAIPQLVVDNPNSDDARRFLAELRPDLLVARCKFILKRAIFEVPRVGTFVLHPGICPEYRNAHGCFWALVNRDLDRVGMTLLRVDPGIDTGPIFFHGTCDIDEVRESHTVIQYRAVLDNLEPIGRTLLALCRGEDVQPVSTAGRHSATWGQPRLTSYLRWKWIARRSRDARRVAAVS